MTGQNASGMQGCYCRPLNLNHFSSASTHLLPEATEPESSFNFKRLNASGTIFGKACAQVGRRVLTSGSPTDVRFQDMR